MTVTSGGIATSRVGGVILYQIRILLQSDDLIRLDFAESLSVTAAQPEAIKPGGSRVEIR